MFGFFEKNNVYAYVISPNQVDISEVSSLDDFEKTRAAAFKLYKDYKLYISAHIFLRNTLSRYASVLPSEWQFSLNKYGKPFVNNKGYEKIQFNLSHTEGLIALVIAFDRIVGVDVEKCKPINGIEKICDSVLSKKETKDVLSKNSSTQKIQCFLTYWTLKESYIKAMGVGLSISLRGLTFVPKMNPEWILYRESISCNALKNWSFFSLPVGENHLLALTVQKKAIGNVLVDINYNNQTQTLLSR